LDVTGSDLVTVALLVALEGLLSADNAMVLAVLVLGLPRSEQRKALRYGIAGAFVFRILAIMLAVHLIEVRIVMLIGAAYLLWLPYNHFTAHPTEDGRRRAPKAAGWLGLSPFWATVAKVELTDIVFAIDSILVAVAMSDKLWVIITGGILGVITMRLVIGQLLVLVSRYPPLVDGAFVIIAWVGIKLVIEYLHEEGFIGFGVPQWLSLGLIVVIFAVAVVWARMKGPEQVDPLAERAGDILAQETGDPENRSPRG
jgi:YkoY family integral membrane protein